MDDHPGGPPGGAWYPVSMAPRDAFVDWLTCAGYRVAVDRRAWVEVFASLGDERWLGRGVDEAAAWAHLEQQLFPSAAARAALARALEGQRGDPVDAPAPSPRASTNGRHEPMRPGAADDVAPAAPAAAAAEENAAPAGLPAPGCEPARATSPASVGRVVPPTASASPPPPREPLPPPAPGPTVEEDLALLADLLDEIDDAEDDLAAWAPLAIRWAFFAWIARARAAHARHTASAECHARAREVAQRLQRLSQVFWPGAIEALRSDTTPAASMSGNLDDGGPPPRTWDDAARRAEAQLDALLDAPDTDRGWHDGAGVVPEPSDAALRFARVLRTLDELLPDARTPPALDPTDHARLVHAAMELRALRRSVDLLGAPTWGRAMGRLRGANRALRDPELRRVLDPTQAPAGGWAHAADTYLREARQRSALASRPPPGVAPEVLWAWLRESFAGLSGDELAEILGPHAEAVAALPESIVPNPDRRLRRRLRALQRVLQDGADAAAADPDDAEDRPSLPPPTPTTPLTRAPDATAQLADLLRPHLAGRRALFVSNRDRGEIPDALHRAIGLEVVVEEGTPRRVDAMTDSIAAGTYDLVLFATGFQSHSAEHNIRRAARLAEVPYVRVHKGRPTACLRALVRDLGLTPDTPPPTDAAAEPLESAP